MSYYFDVDGLDPNGNASANNFIPSYTTTATAAGTTTLTVASTEIQRFTGSTTQTVVLPVASTLPKTGFGFWIVNDSSGSLTVNSSGGNLVATITGGNRLWVFAILLTGTSAASWDTAAINAASPGGSTTQLQRNNAGAFGGISGATSDGTDVTFGSGNLKTTRPKVTTSIDDANGNEVIITPATASAVNEVTIANAATGTGPTISATGGDTNIDLKLTPKGTGNTFITSNSLILGTGLTAADVRLSNNGNGLAISDGTNSYNNLQALNGIFSNAGASVTPIRVSGANSRIELGNASLVVWTNGIDFNFTIDTGLTRNAANVVEINSGTAGTSGIILLRGRAFAALPASPVAGMEATVTDSTTTTWGATITGGGSNIVRAWYNGTNWTVIGK